MVWIYKIVAWRRAPDDFCDEDGVGPGRDQAQIRIALALGDQIGLALDRATVASMPSARIIIAR